ncbi:MAG: cytochrome C oxidase subunit IV family protein [Planctomycetota bacterium]
MNDTSEHNQHGSRNGVFVLVFLMLCALTAVSFWISRSDLMHDPVRGWGAMLAVSIGKSALVAAFFMHLWWEKAWKYVLTIPAMAIGIVLILSLIPDIGYRMDTYSKDRADSAAVHNNDADNPTIGFYGSEQ